MQAVTGQKFHLRIESDSKAAVLSEISGLMDRPLAEHHFYMASLGRTANGGYELSVDIGGPEPDAT